MAVFQSLILVGFPVLLTAALGTAHGQMKRKGYRSHAVRDESELSAVYTASWAVEITQGGDKMADYIARRYGFHNLGKVANITLYNIGPNHVPRV